MAMMLLMAKSMAILRGREARNSSSIVELPQELTYLSLRGTSRFFLDRRVRGIELETWMTSSVAQSSSRIGSSLWVAIDIYI
jgi:hypothetical protein